MKFLVLLLQRLHKNTRKYLKIGSVKCSVYNILTAAHRKGPFNRQTLRIYNSVCACMKKLHVYIKMKKVLQIKSIFCTVYCDNFSFISVFLAMLDLGCVRDSSSCGRGSSLAQPVRWLLLWRAGSRGRWASVVVSAWYWLLLGLWDLWTGDRTHVPCIDWQILSHWTTGRCSVFHLV